METTYNCQLCGNTVELLSQPDHMMQNHLDATEETCPVQPDDEITYGTYTGRVIYTTAYGVNIHWYGYGVPVNGLNETVSWREFKKFDTKASK